MMHLSKNVQSKSPKSTKASMMSTIHRCSYESIDTLNHKLDEKSKLLEFFQYFNIELYVFSDKSIIKTDVYYLLILHWLSLSLLSLFSLLLSPFFLYI